ncbi:hypothetical protein [Erythrobacter fulvus]|nr:hypothetical protein [Erythrobacter fulvus]
MPKKISLLIASIMLVFFNQDAFGNEINSESPLVEIKFTKDGLEGDGGEIIREQLGGAQFVMIGEAHGHADAASLVAALSVEAREPGFQYYAIEVGPFSGNWLRDILSQAGSNGLAKALRGRPLAIPFLNSRNEAEAALVYSQEGRLWGVDQEFIGSPLIHFESLLSMSPTDPDFIATLLEQERTAFANGNQGAIFFARASEADWEKLQTNFNGNADALERIAAMRKSASIYRLFFMGRGLESNLDRVELIRSNFLSFYHAAERTNHSPPRVIMKFGATHAGRSTSPISTFDLGSLVEGMAAENGMEALHIAYMPIGGETLAVTPSANSSFEVRPVSAAELRAMLEAGGIDLTMIDASEGHFLIDLEAVKRRLGDSGLAGLDPMSRFTVLGFDYLITTSKASAASPLADH